MSCCDDVHDNRPCRLQMTSCQPGLEVRHAAKLGPRGNALLPRPFFVHGVQHDEHRVLLRRVDRPLVAVVQLLALKLEPHLRQRAEELVELLDAAAELEHALEGLRHHKVRLLAVAEVHDLTLQPERVGLLVGGRLAPRLAQVLERRRAAERVRRVRLVLRQHRLSEETSWHRALAVGAAAGRLGRQVRHRRVRHRHLVVVLVEEGEALLACAAEAEALALLVRRGVGDLALLVVRDGDDGVRGAVHGRSLALVVLDEVVLVGNVGALGRVLAVLQLRDEIRQVGKSVQDAAHDEENDAEDELDQPDQHRQHLARKEVVREAPQEVFAVVLQQRDEAHFTLGVQRLHEPLALILHLPSPDVRAEARPEAELQVEHNVHQGVRHADRGEPDVVNLNHEEHPEDEENHNGHTRDQDDRAEGRKRQQIIPSEGQNEVEDLPENVVPNRKVRKEPDAEHEDGEPEGNHRRRIPVREDLRDFPVVLEAVSLREHLVLRRIAEFDAELATGVVQNGQHGNPLRLIRALHVAALATRHLPLDVPQLAVTGPVDVRGGAVDAVVAVPRLLALRLVEENDKLHEVHLAQTQADQQLLAVRVLDHLAELDEPLLHRLPAHRHVGHAPAVRGLAPRVAGQVAEDAQEAVELRLVLLVLLEPVEVHQQLLVEVLVDVVDALVGDETCRHHWVGVETRLLLVVACVLLLLLLPAVRRLAQTRKAQSRHARGAGRHELARRHEAVVQAVVVLVRLEQEVVAGDGAAGAAAAAAAARLRTQRVLLRRHQRRCAAEPDRVRTRGELHVAVAVTLRHVLRRRDVEAAAGGRAALREVQGRDAVHAGTLRRVRRRVRHGVERAGPRRRRRQLAHLEHDRRLEVVCVRRVACAVLSVGVVHLEGADDNLVAASGRGVLLVAALHLRLPLRRRRRHGEGRELHGLEVVGDHGLSAACGAVRVVVAPDRAVSGVVRRLRVHDVAELAEHQRAVLVVEVVGAQVGHAPRLRAGALPVQLLHRAQRALAAHASFVGGVVLQGQLLVGLLPELSLLRRHDLLRQHVLLLLDLLHELTEHPQVVVFEVLPQARERQPRVEADGRNDERQRNTPVPEGPKQGRNDSTRLHVDVQEHNGQQEHARHEVRRAVVTEHVADRTTEEGVRTTCGDVLRTTVQTRLNEVEEFGHDDEQEEQRRRQHIPDEDQQSDETEVKHQLDKQRHSLNQRHLDHPLTAVRAAPRGE
eukprot:Rhum_TRINITY_DN14558_c20_g1::Rhum_TRINITY_DN14558_c20_g1_i1::g.101717::m.101717